MNGVRRIFVKQAAKILSKHGTSVWAFSNRIAEIPKDSKAEHLRLFDQWQMALKLVSNITWNSFILYMYFRYGYIAASYSGRMPCSQL